MNAVVTVYGLIRTGADDACHVLAPQLNQTGCRAARPSFWLPDRFPTAP